jgi:hypothetical protein
VQLDSITYGAQPPGRSQGHFPDGTSAIVGLIPTPGSANALAPTDSDNDGIPDAYETANGLNPNNPADAFTDADGDGASNFSEYLAGTNPQQPGSRLTVTVIQTAVPGQLAVRFNAVAGKTYSVRYKSDLSIPTWTKLADVPAQGSDVIIDTPDPGSAGQPQRYYQVVTPAQP